ncbi:MAG: hypothetical protein K6F05_09380 [Succinivibrio sp.]|nr:hypothetical protein [Succinivibrio sp.]
MKRRTGDRCHLISRIPAFDKNGNTCFYSFKYTAGVLYKPDILEAKHAKHILMGFYIRRSMDYFADDQGIAMVSMPMSKDIETLLRYTPTRRMIVHIPQRQPKTALFDVTISQLQRTGAKIAADVNTIIYTNWFRSVKSFSYVVMHMNKYFDEQVRMVNNVRKLVPDIKVICDHLNTEEETDLAFEKGADYVCFPKYTKMMLFNRSNQPDLYKAPSLFEDACDVIYETLKPVPNYDLFLDFVKRYPEFIPMLSDLVCYIRSCSARELKTNLVYFGPYEVEHYKPDDILNYLELNLVNKVIIVYVLAAATLTFNTVIGIRERKLNFEPFKIALLRTKFVELMCLSVCDREDINSKPIYQCVVAELLPLFSAQPANGNSVLHALQIEANKIIEAEPVLKNAIQCANAVEAIDIHEIDKLIQAKTFELKNIVVKYENAVFWSVAITQILTKRYINKGSKN